MTIDILVLDGKQPEVTASAIAEFTGYNVDYAATPADAERLLQEKEYNALVVEPNSTVPEYRDLTIKLLHDYREYDRTVPILISSTLTKSQLTGFRLEMGKDYDGYSERLSSICDDLVPKLKELVEGN